MLLKRGAEAELRRTRWHGRDAVEKLRVPKSYRLASLDDRLRTERTRSEVRLMSDARKAGVAVPIIYDVDLEERRITMQYVAGPTAKRVLDRGGPRAQALCGKIGRLAARLHRAGIAHGDLTPSNLIVARGRLWAIDFSLGERTTEVEARGVDLHLVREALVAAHRHGEAYFAEVGRAYRRGYPAGAVALAKAEEIRLRGRYT